MNDGTCKFCDAPLTGKRSHAKYCDRQCKGKASEVRRRDDGRAKQRDRARYSRERDARIAWAVDYSRRNPEKAQLAKRKRRARIRSHDVLHLTSRDWLRLRRRYDDRCAYCRRSIPLTIDHVVPITRGGRHAIGNILPACMSCNASKGNRLLVEWYRWLEVRGALEARVPGRSAKSREAGHPVDGRPPRCA